MPNLKCMEDEKTKVNLGNRWRWFLQILSEFPLWWFSLSIKWVWKWSYLREILNNPHDIKGWYGIMKRE